MINFAISLANTAIALANSAINSAVDYYNRAIKFVNTMFTIASTLWNTAVLVAKMTVLSILYELYGIAVGLVWSVKSILEGYVISKFLEAYNLYLTIRAYADSIVTLAKAALLSEILNIKAYLLAFIAVAVSPFMPLINSLLGLFIGLKAVVDFMVAFLSPGNIQKLLHTINDIVPFVTSIMNDPFAWIASIIEAFLWPMLQFILAYLWGTTLYDLPPKPDFSKGMGITANGTVVYIPALDTNFNRPIDPLYVSGNRFSEEHPGTDYGLHMGQEVYAIHDGVVGNLGCGAGAYGNCIDISGGRFKSRYAHLQTILAAPGLPVAKGQLIALGDSTGNSTGPHLHIEIWIDGVRVNPENHL